MFNSFFNQLWKKKDWVFEERTYVSGIDPLYSSLFGYIVDFNLWKLGITTNRVVEKQVMIVINA